MDTLLRRHQDRMFAVCRRITGNDADAADATQEAMVSVVRSLAKFDGRSSFGTWVYRIASNSSLDELRRRRRRPTLTLDASGDHGSHVDELADPHAGVHIDAMGDRHLLDAALATLSDEFRLPVVLRDVADLDYAEIASVLDLPLGTVKSRIARGRAALAAEIGRASGNQGPGGERPRGAP